MSHSHHPSSGGSPESLRAGHELSDVQVKPLLQFGVMMAIVVALTMWGVYVMHKGLDEFFAERAPEPHPMQSSGAAPAGPRLQSNEAADFRKFAAEQTSHTTSDSAYIWIDKPTEVVRVPIERAMELVLEEGLPHRTEGK
jgi:hypothetical protein